MKKLPIGLSDFKTIIEDNYYYVDKSLFIKEVYEVSGQVILIPRPRRFGKTLNLSMLKYFFGKSNTDHSYLFKDTYIWNEKKYKELQGQYPIIYLTFKDVKENNWKSAYEHLIKIIANQFHSYSFLMSKSLSEYQLSNYKAILDKTGSEIDYSKSLLFLSEFLYNYYQKKVIVLIDEYDAPIHAGYASGFYNEVIQFMRSLLTSVLKDNQYLEKGVLTGILRTAKEGIFSGLKNLSVYTLLDTEFENKFGFTESEVKQLLKDWELEDQLSQVQEWYN